MSVSFEHFFDHRVPPSMEYHPSFGIPPPPPPRVARKTGKNILWWSTDEGSLASRSIGKVNIDCRLRLSESKWGVLEGSQPAGILYVDLTFDQPAHCRLASATVLISLEECEDDDKGKDKEDKDKDEITLSRLRVCEFGPKLLTGEPTTFKRRTEYSFTPEVNAGVAGFGGLGVKRQNSINYVSRWVLKGNTLAPADKKRKTPGIVYRTLKWELTENELAFQPIERSVVHTAFAFEHELKRFYIKVEISGKLSDAVDRLKHRVFPPRMKKNQGTLFTLVDLRAEDKARKENLDNLARRLEEQMREKNLISLSTKRIEESGINEDQKESPKTSSPGEPTGSVDLADLAMATEKFAPPPRPDNTLRPGRYQSTPTPSFSSMATTLAPFQSDDASLEAPPNRPRPKSKQEPEEDRREDHKPSKRMVNTPKSEPKPATVEDEEEDEENSDLKRGKIKKSEDLKVEEEKDDEEEEEAGENAAKAMAEVQFVEVLIMLRAWVYATFFALFLRNQQQYPGRHKHRKAISSGYKSDMEPI